MYVQFAGRVLLIFLFIGFVFSGQWSLWRIIVSLFGLGACIMVIVGFKAKWSAILLVVLLSVFNVLVNNFWTVCFCIWFSWFRTLLTDWISSTLTTPTRILPSTTSSRSSLLCKFSNPQLHFLWQFINGYRLAAVWSSWSTWALVN